jgi:TolB-like protein/DNA-binding winged helix-turn-helix (wHTH) protein
MTGDGTPAGTPTVYRFGPFEYRPRAVELRRDGRPVRLQELPLQILEALLERPGELVTRDEMQRRLWPAGTHVEFDNSLNAAVSKLRDALRDSASDPLYVATVPRRGYRFIAAVETEPAAEPSPAPRSTRESRSRFVLVAVGLVIVAAVVAVTLVVRRDESPPLPPATDTVRKMLAVLPLDNLGGDPQQEFFSAGLTEEIITRLSKLNPERLGVIARTSVMQYRGASPTVRQVTAELGVQYLIEGSVRRQGPTVRITVQLIDTKSRAHLWAETFDRELEQSLTVQSEIARRVAEALALELLPFARPDPRSMHTTAFESYEAYLQGRYLMTALTREGLEQALERFDRALELEPRYAAAHQGRADAYSLLGIYDYWRPRDAFARAREAADTALELDPSDAGAHLCLAGIQAAFEWDPEAAQTLYHGRTGQIRFVTGKRPLLVQWGRRLRQLLQQRYNL